MSRFRPGRFIGVTVGTLAILAVGVYGPATLLGPLPQASATLVIPPAATANPSPPALPSDGASAVAALDTQQSLASGGTEEALPLASIAKIVTALVVLDAKPIQPGEPGPIVTITATDYEDYIGYSNAGARTVALFPGEKWSERELLQAMILGSSNNHADTLGRWAFGSIDAYRDTAIAWLAENGLPGIHVVDTNGLHDDSVGVAADLAHLAGMAASNDVIAAILANPASALVGRRGVDNTTAYLSEEGIKGISRSYTDAAGVCFLFTATVGEGDSAFAFSGAFLGEPDYDTLSLDLTALMESARAGVGELPILAEGDAYAKFQTPWGDTASGVIGVSKTRLGWLARPFVSPSVKLDTFSTGRRGRTVGRVSVDAFGETVSAPLVLDRAISDPGPGWRLLNPVPVISALIESLGT